LVSAPEIQTIDDPAKFRVLTLHSLIQMLLTSNGNEESMLLRDLVGVGLVDYSWLPEFPPELAERLQQILDTPDAYSLRAEFSSFVD